MTKGEKIKSVAMAVLANIKKAAVATGKFISRTARSLADKIKRRLRFVYQSLYVGLVFAIILGAVVGASVYIITKISSDFYINENYVTEQERSRREEEYLLDLQNYVTSNALSSADADRIAEWAKDNRYVYLLIYKDDELFFETDSDGEGEKDNQIGSGVTVNFPTREELIEYAEKNDLYQIFLADNVTLFASIAEFTEYLYYDIANIANLALAMLAMAYIIINHFRRIIGRIRRLETDVNIVSGVNMQHAIVSEGYDEIARLSTNVENMRNTILENLDKEREAREANTELVTAMSHDIRTPLTVLLGYLDMMRGQAEGDEVMTGYINASEKTAMRLKQLSDDMFKYSLAFGDTGKGIKLEEYDAIMLMDQLLAEHILLLRENGYTVKMTRDGDEVENGATVFTDAPNLMRIIDNIFSNLYKYADKDSPICFLISCTEGKLVLECRNSVKKDTSEAESNGIGMKTCSRLASFIAERFEFGEEQDGFFTRLVLRLKTGEEQ